MGNIKKMQHRREFIKKAGGLTLGVGVLGLSGCAGGGKSEESDGYENTATTKEMFFKISLAEWSLHNTLFAGEMTNLDFPEMTKQEFGISGVEYVNQFFKDKAKDTAYLADLKGRCDDNGVESVLIMCDGEGNLGDADEGKRIEAVENHFRWVEAAKYLGCHSIRVNARGEGTAEEVSGFATDGLAKLSAFAKDFDISVIVENHGGYSSDGQWLSTVIKNTGMDNCGTLPDFGNFCIEASEDGCLNEYDRYVGVEELMPYATGVSAKSNAFDADGNETKTDYRKMLQIVKRAGYTGYIGVEYEGDSEKEGIIATKNLLEKIGKEMA